MTPPRTPHAPVAPVSGLRYNHKEGYFELKCPACPRDGSGVWWQITLDNWDPHYGYARCRSCACKVKNDRMREVRATRRDVINARNRVYYKENSDVLRMKQQMRDDENWEAKKAYNRKRYAENREAILAYRKRKRVEARQLRQMERQEVAA